jgi:hypothetical protein
MAARRDPSRMQRLARSDEDDRLPGRRRRPGCAPLCSAPAIPLPDGRLALCRVELGDDEQRRRVTHWARSRRGAAVLEGPLELAAVAVWQALAAVERALAEAGVRLG